MKKIIFLFCTLCTLSFSQAQDFNKYERMNGVSSVLITSEMFKLLAEIDFDSSDPEVQNYVNLIENLKDIKVLSTSKPAIAQQLEADVNAYIASSQLKELMRVNEDGNDARFYFEAGDSAAIVKRLIMFFKGEENGEKVTVAMSISGNIDLKQVSKLAKDLKVPGADALKDVEPK
ncbi:MAG: DUF4252 domain-containing protein [Mesonia hippocampi]|uniref:DUF4252 domain-containing protein n=1 Tax=Mesonia hippocampi TaxID=1628250 RepID=UPI003F979474